MIQLHMDLFQGLDALMSAIQKWNGGVIIISHDERFITTVSKEVRIFEMPIMVKAHSNITR